MEVTPESICMAKQRGWNDKNKKGKGRIIGRHWRKVWACAFGRIAKARRHRCALVCSMAWRWSQPPRQGWASWNTPQRHRPLATCTYEHTHQPSWTR